LISKCGSWKAAGLHSANGITDDLMVAFAISLRIPQPCT